MVERRCQDCSGFPVPSCGHTSHQGGEDEPCHRVPIPAPLQSGELPRVNQGSPGTSGQLGVPMQGLELDLAQLHPQGCLGILWFQKELTMPEVPVPADAFCSRPGGG